MGQNRYPNGASHSALRYRACKGAAIRSYGPNAKTHANTCDENKYVAKSTTRQTRLTTDRDDENEGLKAPTDDEEDETPYYPRYDPDTKGSESSKARKHEANPVLAPKKVEKVVKLKRPSAKALSRTTKPRMKVPVEDSSNKGTHKLPAGSSQRTKKLNMFTQLLSQIDAAKKDEEGSKSSGKPSQEKSSSEGCEPQSSPPQEIPSSESPEFRPKSPEPYPGEVRQYWISGNFVNVRYPFWRFDKFGKYIRSIGM